jgi:hypothetical protein
MTQPDTIKTSPTPVYRVALHIHIAPSVMSINNNILRLIIFHYNSVVALSDQPTNTYQVLIFGYNGVVTASHPAEVKRLTVNFFLHTFHTPTILLSRMCEMPNDPSATSNIQRRASLIRSSHLSHSLLAYSQDMQTNPYDTETYFHQHGHARMHRRVC